MIIHTIAYDITKSPSVSDITPIIEENDVIILAAYNGDADTTLSVKCYLCPTNVVPYSTRRSLNQVMANGDNLTNEMFRLVEGSSGNLKFYNLTDIATNDILGQILVIIKSAATEGSETKNIDELINALAGGDEVIRYNIDGTEWNPPPAAVPDFDVLIESNARDDIISLVRIIDPALKYLGFNPRYMRSVFCGRSNNIDVLTRDLILIFAGYCHVANNITKLSKKRVNIDVSRKVMSSITAIGIVKKATNKDHMTLPRIAIAFMPEYLIYRKFLVNNLQNQTEADIAVEYKDIIFHGCTEISGKTNYLQFHKEFSALIYKPDTETDLEDKTFLKNYNRWSKVTKSGYKSDTQIHQHMSNAINATGLTREAAYDLINANLTFYKSNP